MFSCNDNNNNNSSLTIDKVDHPQLSAVLGQEDEQREAVHVVQEGGNDRAGLHYVIFKI